MAKRLSREALAFNAQNVRYSVTFAARRVLIAAKSTSCKTGRQKAVGTLHGAKIDSQNSEYILLSASK